MHMTSDRLLAAGGALGVQWLMILATALGTVAIFGGCGKKVPKVNPCSLVATEQVQKVTPTASIATFEPRIKDNPALLCAWRDGDGKVVAMLFVQPTSGGAPDQKLSAFLGRSARVVGVSAVGAQAAAAFSKDARAGTERMEIIMADDGKWNVNFRALGVGDETTSEFEAARDVVLGALSRLASLK